MGVWGGVGGWGGAARRVRRVGCGASGAAVEAVTCVPPFLGPFLLRFPLSPLMVSLISCSPASVLASFASLVDFSAPISSVARSRFSSSLKHAVSTSQRGDALPLSAVAGLKCGRASCMNELKPCDAPLCPFHSFFLSRSDVTDTPCNSATHAQLG